jgi:DNA-binding CsgD family transcriptional regulator
MTRVTSSHVLYDTDQVSNLIGSIYAAASDTRGWDVFAEHLGEALDLRAVNFMLSSTEPDGQVGFIPVAWGFDEGGLEQYSNHYVHLDPQLPRAVDLPTGAVSRNHQLFSDDDFVRSEFYNDYYSKVGLRHVFVGMIRNEGQRSSLIACHRGTDQPAPTDEDLRLLDLLMGHLQRARALAVEFGTLKEAQRISNDTLDRMRVGAIFLDRHGAVMHANQRAQQIMRENDGLSVVDQRLQAARTSSSKALSGVIEVAAAATQGVTLDGPVSIRLPRPSGRRPLDVTAMPIGEKSRWWAVVRASVCLMVNDGESTLEGAAKRLSQLYQLSPVEADLAVAISSGHTVRDWAEQRGVSVETVRWQLKQVFAKTGTSRQPELMRMVLQGPGLLR